MDEGRFFALVALLAVLFWLLGGQKGIDPRLRRWALPVAYVTLAIGLAYAFLRTLLFFFG
ncbi:MAG: hypothetical protein N2038_08705 [Geminicoccaceae bacterium]|nr:hypothetical protein [Geminicoccaceae bacterium]